MTTKKPSAKSPQAAGGTTLKIQAPPKPIGVANFDPITEARGARTAAWAAMLVMASGLAWAACTEIDTHASVPGTVVATAGTFHVGHQEGGILKEVLVSEGQYVKQGDVLLRLDPTQAKAAAGERTEHIAALEARIARLTAEADGKPFEDDGRGSPYMSRATGRTRRSNSQVSSLAETVRRGTATAAAERKTLDGLRTQVKAQEEAVRRAGVGGGLVSPAHVHEEESRLLAMQTELQSLPSKIEAAEADAQAAEQQRAATAAEWRSERRQQASTALAELRGLRENADGANDKLRRIEVLATVSGTVDRLFVRSPGENVRPLSDVATIVPDDGRVQVEVRIPSRSIKGLHAGLPALIRLSSADMNKHRSVSGKLLVVSPDASKVEGQDPRQEPTFWGKVSMDSTKIGDETVRPGMTATVNIITGKRTVLSYILTPMAIWQDEAFSER